ncbi:MAG: hypothetical protein HY319_07480 [Armatimonadetes bacterium]|nr:hypothetical protein [Armatimonadota bacterium]
MLDIDPDAKLPSGREKAEKAIALLIDDDVITPDVLDSIAKAASKIEVDSSLERKEWRAMARRLEKTGSLEASDMNAIRKFSNEVRSLHNRLHQEYRESDYTDKKLNKELENVHVFLSEFEEPRRRYLEAASQVQLQALVGCSFANTASIAAYLAWSGTTEISTRALVDELDKLDSGKSALIRQGNRVRPARQEQLWQAKMELLNEAIELASQGKPPEIDMQYFELTSATVLGKVAEAARKGCKIRINIDPSRPQNGGLAGMRVDDGPRKLRALLQLASIEGADVGISVYPVATRLGGLDQLMHRKLLRVGDKVLLGGMNANQDSGENVDAGYVIEGPAARTLVEGFARDVRDSIGITLEDVFGEGEHPEIWDENLTLTPHGLGTLLDAMAGPSPAGSRIPQTPSYEQLEALAGTAGIELPDLVELDEDELRAAVEKDYASTMPLPVSDVGRELLGSLLAKAFEKLNSPENIKRLQDISLPAGEPVGVTAVGVADNPVEREALLLHAIRTAEEFVYAPIFVITRPVARALAARAEELKAQGKKLDVRVIADAGIYQFGGTPNEYGVTALEDAGIPVRWALLPRTDKHHDRKIHAKQVVTDKMEFFGSTNLSAKGMKDNWEISGLVFFDEKDPDSISARDQGKARFLKLWENESFDLDSRSIAEKRLEGVRTKDVAMRIEEARRSSIMSALNRIRVYENEAADFLHQKAQDPAIAERVRQNELAGMSHGYALLQAVEKEMGSEAYYAELHRLPSMTKLLNFRRTGD